MRKSRKPKCAHCNQLFRPDPRNVKRQKYCSRPECRKASKAASQKKWLEKPENQDYFQGTDNTMPSAAVAQSSSGILAKKARAAGTVTRSLNAEFSGKTRCYTAVVEPCVTRSLVGATSCFSGVIGTIKWITVTR